MDYTLFKDIEYFLPDLYHSHLKKSTIRRNLRDDLVLKITQCRRSHCRWLLFQHIIAGKHHLSVDSSLVLCRGLVGLHTY